MSPKSFVRQVFTALTRETDAFRPDTRGVRSRDSAAQVVAALARVPIVPLPDSAPPSNDLGGRPSQDNTEPCAADTRGDHPSREQGTHPRVQIGLSRPSLPQPRRPRGARGRLLSAGEVADRLGVSKSAVWRMVRQRKLPGAHLGSDRTLRVPEAVVDKMATEMREHSDPA
ncbi:helix-turn-helix domain-containing protein [Streptomyces misionensis]|uniref:Helix-turn-helix domain-containing protein n=1 Tax=Streptomyces misionensis TaxID=67331 RepID=A0A5C6JVA6_9ACTN|nr:helix-turn-helix domain-containing protein [Streptomyces misionensis]